jgi:hypothetical protein
LPPGVRLTLLLSGSPLVCLLSPLGLLPPLLLVASLGLLPPDLRLPLLLRRSPLLGLLPRLGLLLPLLVAPERLPTLGLVPPLALLLARDRRRPRLRLRGPAGRDAVPGAAHRGTEDRHLVPLGLVPTRGRHGVHVHHVRRGHRPADRALQLRDGDPAIHDDPVRDPVVGDITRLPEDHLVARDG